MDADCFGDSFAFGCADGSIRIHDSGTLQRSKALVKMANRGLASSGAISSLKYHPEDPNIIIGATTSRVVIWDVRTGDSERSISGTHVRGPGLAVYHDSIYTASFRESHQLESWDFGTAKRISEFAFDAQGEKPAQLNSVSVSRNGLLLVAGGTGLNHARVFDTHTGMVLGTALGMATPVSIVAMAPYGSAFACGSETGAVQFHFIRGRSA
jgi:WD40 repeat protein